ALRSVSPGGKPAHTISVSIDPTQEGLAKMNQWIRSNPPNPANPSTVAPFVEGMKEAQGLHTVTVNGVSPKTHFALTMVEADYRMKLIGIGLEPPPVRSEERRVGKEASVEGEAADYMLETVLAGKC